MLSIFVNLLQSSTYQNLYIHTLSWWNLYIANLYFDELDQDWFLWYETKKLVIPFFCVTFFFSTLFIHALWVSTSGILQTSLDIHPKPKISFCDYLLDHNPLWVWIIISTESKESRASYKEKFWETRLPEIQVVLRRRRWIWYTYPS